MNLKSTIQFNSNSTVMEIIHPENIFFYKYKITLILTMMDSLISLILKYTIYTTSKAVHLLLTNSIII